VFDPTKADEHGSIDIPNKDSFYFVLFAKQLYLLASRRDQLRQTVKVLDMNQVSPSFTDNHGEQSGGIVSLGALDEGYCLKITATV